MGFIWSRASKHACSLGFESDSMLPRVDGKKLPYHSIRKLLLISVLHPHTDKVFHSYPAMVAERQRQISAGAQWVIHPFSMFNLIWCTIMVFINLAFITIAPFRFSYILPTVPATYSTYDYVLMVLKCLCGLDILLKLNTGYWTKKEDYIVLVRKKIILHYMMRWFLVDLISCMPVYILIPLLQPWSRVQMFLLLIPCIRCARVYTILQDFWVFIKLFSVKYLHAQCLRHVVLFFVTVHWCACLIYLPRLTIIYWPGMGLEEALALEPFNSTIAERYERAFFITCTSFFGTTFGRVRSTIPGEIIVNSLIVLYGQLFLVYTMVLLLKVYLVIYDSTMKYQELMDQVEKYMRYKEIPQHMVQRVRDFYHYRYQRKYFKERFVLDCLSEQLRNEIFLDRCHKLIDKVALFEGLPAGVIGAVLGCLKPEVYLRNDLIIKAGDAGECMYFIASGTVAVYSLKGAEVCHLEDGAHFGEVALLMSDRKRVASVVAIEITQLYRLDLRDFQDFVLTYHELYARVEELAAKRMHETVLIDEAYKQTSLHKVRSYSQ